ncbi:MAG: branched-chain amino acid ABC transporter permease [Alphaproteobacteria bacterium]
MADFEARPDTPAAALDWRRLAGIATPFVLLALVLLYGVYGASAYEQRVIVILGIDIMLVLSLNLFNGFTGVFSLGHVGFMALGAYASAILSMPVAHKAINLPDLPGWLAGVELGFLPATLAAGLFAAAVAVVIGLPVLRLSGHYVAVATLSFLVIVRVVLINAVPFTRGSRTFFGTPAHTTVWWVYAWVLVTIYISWRMLRSPYGRAMLAQREDRVAAQAVGVNVLRTRLLPFVLSAFLTAVAGALWGHYILSFSPNAFYFAETFTIITMLVVGGTGSISGAVIGTVLIVVLTEMLRELERGFSLGVIEVPPLYGLSQILMAVAFISVLIFRREGLLGYGEIDFSRLFVKRRRPRDGQQE